MARYDEAEIKARLARLDRSQKTAFAAACADGCGRCSNATRKLQAGAMSRRSCGPGRCLASRPR